MEMEEHTWDACGSYLRGIAVYFLYSPNARKKTLFWRDAKIGFIYSLTTLLVQGGFFVCEFDLTDCEIRAKVFIVKGD